MIFALFAMLGCAVETTPGDDSASRAEDPETAECFASYGDNCGCVEQCLTELQTWQAGPGCEADCPTPYWDCLNDEGECVRFEWE